MQENLGVFQLKCIAMGDNKSEAEQLVHHILLGKAVALIKSASAARQQQIVFCCFQLLSSPTWRGWRSQQDLLSFH